MRLLPAILAGLASFAFAVAPPSVAAQQQQAQRPAAVTQFDELTVRYLLADIQANYRLERAVDGSVVYRASAEGEINFTLSPRACTPQGVCTGLMLIAVFNGINAPDAARFDAFINRFNDSNPTAKIMRDGRGVVALQSYINAAYGISYRNAQAQLLVFGENIVLTSRALAEFENGG